MSDESTRGQIVSAADRLFYERGYEHTSFADIAEVVGISRGNFYHHFKSKDEILKAVIEVRLAATRAMLAGWEVDHTMPVDRIRRFIDILNANRAPIMRHGCPVGSLCSELARLGHPSRHEAAGLFGLFRSWLAREFVRLGRARDADRLALHLIGRSQGVAVMANAFGDEKFIRREVRQLHAWLARNSAERNSAERNSAERNSRE